MDADAASPARLLQQLRNDVRAFLIGHDQQAISRLLTHVAATLDDEQWQQRVPLVGPQQLERWIRLGTGSMSDAMMHTWTDGILADNSASASLAHGFPLATTEVHEHTGVIFFASTPDLGLVVVEAKASDRMGSICIYNAWKESEYAPLLSSTIIAMLILTKKRPNSPIANII
jgi:hypothetical protein